VRISWQRNSPWLWRYTYCIACYSLLEVMLVSYYSIFNVLVYVGSNLRLWTKILCRQCHSWCKRSQYSHCGYPTSVPGYSILGLYWTQLTLKCFSKHVPPLPLPVIILPTPDVHQLALLQKARMRLQLLSYSPSPQSICTKQVPCFKLRENET
jgi:hypothetical protein